MTPPGGREFVVAVKNLGTKVWAWGAADHPQIRLSYRWLARDGKVVVPRGRETLLPGSVDPGDRALIIMVVLAPPPGHFLLESIFSTKCSDGSAIPSGFK